MAKRDIMELRTRCADIIDDEEILLLVKKSSSPTAAFDMILFHTNNQNKAKSGRWLAVLRRDYPDEYESMEG